MNEVLKKKVQEEGYCCIYWMLNNARSQRTAELVKYWDVSRRTIQYWKAKLRAGDCKCENAVDCERQRSLSSTLR